jgi:hypothetical protein
MVLGPLYGISLKGKGTTVSEEVLQPLQVQDQQQVVSILVQTPRYNGAATS